MGASVTERIDQIVVEPGAFEAWLSDHDSAWSEEEAEEAADRLAAHIERHYGPLESMQLSLDVFDTAVLRTEICEEERFFRVSERLAGGDRDLALEIFLARYRAHKLAYAVVPPRDGTPEASFADIVVALRAALGFRLAGSLDHAAFEAAELAWETEQLRPNPFLVAFLRRHAVRRPVWFLSDMYLSPGQIGSILAAKLPDIETRMYVSNELRLSKRAGTLYHHVCVTEDVESGRVLHMGDNRIVDVVRAKEAGMKALHLPIPTAELERRKASHDRFLARFREETGLDLDDLF